MSSIWFVFQYLGTISRVLIAVALLSESGVDSSPVDTFGDLIDVIKNEDNEAVIKERSLNNEASNHDNSVDRISEIENIKEADDKSSEVAKISETYSVAQDRTLLQVIRYKILKVKKLIPLIGIFIQSSYQYKASKEKT